MKRFHLHVSVKDLDESVRFYSTLFATQPVVRQTDYAKWMLEDPRINFAVSTDRQPVGINHLGFQLDSDEELRGMHGQLKAADSRLIQENEQPCCYARSDKYWVTVPPELPGRPFTPWAASRSTAKTRRSLAMHRPPSPQQKRKATRAACLQRPSLTLAVSRKSQVSPAVPPEASTAGIFPENKASIALREGLAFGSARDGAWEK